MRLLSLLVGTAAVALLVAGCGGGSGTSTDAGGEARLSHTEWVSQADAICSVDHEANAKRESEFEGMVEGGLTTAKVREEAAELIRGAVPSVETEFKGIRALRPPPEDEAEVIRVVGGLERTAQLDEKVAEALETGSAHELEVVIGMVAANGQRLETLAGDLGTKVCGRPHSGAGAERAGGEGGARQSEWRSHANDICRTAHEAIAVRLEEFEQVLRKGLKTPRSQREAAEAVRGGIATIETEIGSFRALTPPAGLESEARGLVERLETAIELEAEFAEVLEAGDPHALRGLIGQIVKNEIALRGLALHLGLRVCGKLLQSQGDHSLA